MRALPVRRLGELIFSIQIGHSENQVSPGWNLKTRTPSYALFLLFLVGSNFPAKRNFLFSLQLAHNPIADFACHGKRACVHLCIPIRMVVFSLGRFAK